MTHGGTDGLTVVTNEEDGKGEPVFLSHLLGKDLYEVLENTVSLDIRKGLQYLQEAALLVLSPGDEKECLLVPRIAFVNAYALPFQQIFMAPPLDSGNDNQKLLVDTNTWNPVAQSGAFRYDNTNNIITGVTWQNYACEDVARDFRDKASVTFEHK
jgi:hypothetical protein